MQRQGAGLQGDLEGEEVAGLQEAKELSKDGVLRGVLVVEGEQGVEGRHVGHWDVGAEVVVVVGVGRWVGTRGEAEGKKVRAGGTTSSRDNSIKVEGEGGAKAGVTCHGPEVVVGSRQGADEARGLLQELLRLMGGKVVVARRR